MKQTKKFSPKQAMRLALQSAEKGLGWVEPNPPVGCVILDSNYQFLSAGWHKKYGDDHAEIQALKKITNKKKLNGAQVFITLEPCHHTGKTPSCAKALTQYPIQSVTYGAEDPFTDKKGLKHLQKKGVQIIRSPFFQEEMEKLVATFKFSFLSKKPFVSLKAGTSLDGMIALKDGKSQWITNEKAREHAHFLRATHSAVLIGVGTFLKDNPQLNIRLNRFKEKKNKVIILDPKGKSLPALLQSKLLKVHSPDQIIIICSAKIKNHQTKALSDSIGIRIKFFKTIMESERTHIADKNVVERTQTHIADKNVVERTQTHIADKNNNENEMNNLNYTNKELIYSNKEPIHTNTKELFPLPDILKNLYQEEKIQSILVEGGAFCHSQFLKKKVAQRLYLYIAPRIIGRGKSWSQDFSIKNLSESLNLQSVKALSLGNNFLLEGFFK